MVGETTGECGVTPRTIQRDLQSLDRTRVPPWEEGHLYGVLDGYFLPPLHLELNEAAAVCLAARSWAPGRAAVSNAAAASVSGGVVGEER
jgi:predicted DNA-binding transcriptional regulator YafY